MSDLPCCPRCNSAVFQKSLDGNVKSRTSILVFEPGPQGRVLVKCRKCKADVPIDVVPGTALRKALAADGPRLLVSRNPQDSA